MRTLTFLVTNEMSTDFVVVENASFRYARISHTTQQIEVDNKFLKLTFAAQDAIIFHLRAYLSRKDYFAADEFSIKRTLLKHPDCDKQLLFFEITKVLLWGDTQLNRERVEKIKILLDIQ